METRKTYCFDYLVAKSAVPRHRTCCPFMQRTIYRLSRNLARMDLGFSCPNMTPTGNANNASSSGSQEMHENSESGTNVNLSSNNQKSRKHVAVWNWLMNGKGHFVKSPDLPPRLPDNKVTGVLGELSTGELETRIPFALPFDCNAILTVDGKRTSIENGSQENKAAVSPICTNPNLRNKRKQLRRQKMKDFDIQNEDSGTQSIPQLANNCYGASYCDSVSRNVEKTSTQTLETSSKLLTTETEKRLNLCTVQVKRVHARRVSSASQPGWESFDKFQSHSPPLPRTSRCPITSMPLGAFENNSSVPISGAVLNRTIIAHKMHSNSNQNINGPEITADLPKQTTPIQSAVIPPFTVRDPVEKQVQNWLESTADEYNILLNRKCGKMQMSQVQKGTENRSLELRQVSYESAKRQCPETSSRKRTPRLWKQTTPMSQAIIHNHLEQQQQQIQSNSVSPLKTELTVPYLGFDSGEGSMLHSLEENPEEDLMSLLPPVSAQRRYSDNPLVTKPRICCGYQVNAPAKLNFSSQHLALRGKLLSAPARSFCCIYHQQSERGKAYQSPKHVCSCNPLRSHIEMPQHFVPNVDVLLDEALQLRHALFDRRSNSENPISFDEQSHSYGVLQGAAAVFQPNTSQWNSDDWLRNIQLTPIECKQPLSPRSVMSQRSNIPSSPVPLVRVDERLSRQICRNRLKNSVSDINNEEEGETMFSFFSFPPPQFPTSTLTERLVSIASEIPGGTRGRSFEMDPERDIPMPSFSSFMNDNIQQSFHSNTDDNAPIVQQVCRLIPPDLVFSPASRRVSAVDISDDIAAPKNVMEMLSVTASRQLSRQNSIHSFEEVIDSCSPVSINHSLSAQGSLGSDRVYRKSIHNVVSAERPWVSTDCSFEQFPAKISPHRAASHSPSHVKLLKDYSSIQFQMSDELTLPKTAPTSHLFARSADHMHRPCVEMCTRPILYKARGQNLNRDCSSSSCQGIIRLPQSNSEEHETCVCKWPHLTAQNTYSGDPNSGTGPTDVSSSRTPEFFSLDSSSSDPIFHLEAIAKDHGQVINTGEAPSKPITDRGLNPESKPKTLAISVDYLPSHRGQIGQNVHNYREKSRRVAEQNRRKRNRGNELHPRKSLEVDCTFSAGSRSSSIQSAKSMYQKESQSRPSISKARSSDIEAKESKTIPRQHVSGYSLNASPRRPSMTSAMSNSRDRKKREFQRDYTIDEKTDEIFQAFLQHDPALD